MWSPRSRRRVYLFLDRRAHGGLLRRGGWKSCMKSRLQEEIHKKHPFEHPEDEAILNLLRTHSVLFSATERFLRNHDLSMATYNVLCFRSCSCLELRRKAANPYP